MKYRAFISYSHRDKGWGDWLHKGLEHYRVPKPLVGRETARGEPVPARIFPVFRDREELPTAVDLGQIINAALEQSAYLIIICSPASAQSRWVNQEIINYKRLDRENRVLAIIVDGEPNAADGKPGFTADQECFPPALKFKLAPNGELSSERTEPIAADARSHADGKSNALLKLIAGVLGVNYDDLKRRDEVQRRRRQRIILATVSVLALVISSLAVVAWLQRNQAQRAAERATSAERKTAAQLLETEKQLERSQLEEGRAWLERARTAKRNGDHLTAAMLAGRAVGFQGFGRREPEDPGIAASFPHLLGKRMTADPANEGARQKEIAELNSFFEGKNSNRLATPGAFHQDVIVAEGRHPTSLPLWSSPLNIHHHEVIMAIAYSPDGTLLATGSGDNTAKLWDAVSGKELKILRGHSENVKSIAFSPDGSRLATGSWDRLVKVWEIATGRELATLSGHPDAVNSVAFSVDGRRLATGSADKSVKLWDVASGKELASLQRHLDAVEAVAFSPDGSRLVSASRDGTLNLWDAATGEHISQLQGNSGRIDCVAFSPDGRQLASSSENNLVNLWHIDLGKVVATLLLPPEWSGALCVSFSPDGARVAAGTYHGVKLWDVATGKEVASLLEARGGIWSIAFSPDGSRIAGGTTQRAVRACDIATGKEVGDFEGHLEPVVSVAFDPEGRYVVTASWDHTAKLWDVATGKDVGTFVGHTEEVASVAVSADGRYLATGSADKSVKLWEIATQKELSTFTGHTAGILSVAFSPGGRQLATASRDKQVKLWDVTSGKETATFAGHSKEVHSVAFSPDGRQLASGSADNMVKLWDVATGRELQTLKGHTDVVESVSFSSDGALLASASGDRSIRLWDTATRKELAVLSGHSAPVRSVVFSPDNRRVASGSADTSVKVWDVVSRKQIITLSGHLSIVQSVAFSPDGTRLASGSFDMTVKVWDMRANDHAITLEGHSNVVFAVAYSPDGRLIATGSGDDNIKVWDLATARELVTLEGHSDSVDGLAFSPDGRRLASCSSDQTVKLWDLGLGKEVATLKGHSKDVNSLAFSSNGSRLATASSDGTAKIWDVAAGVEVVNLSGHTKAVTGVAFDADAERVITGSEDATMKVWDMSTGTLLATLENSQGILNVAFSAARNQVATCSGDWSAVVKVWSLANGQQTGTLQGHSRFVVNAAFSPDGLRLATGSYDRTVKLWDVPASKELTTLYGHSEEVLAMAFSPDGTSIASGSRDMTAKIWNPAVDNGLGADKAVDLPGESTGLYDLLHFQRERLFRLEQKEIVWQTNPSLFRSINFTPVYRGNDATTALASAGLSAKDRAALRLKRVGKTSQWRAAVQIWNNIVAEDEALAEDAELRGSYLTLILTAARQLVATADHQALDLLFPEITKTLRVEDLAAVNISLPLVALLGELDPASPDQQRVVHDLRLILLEYVERDLQQTADSRSALEIRAELLHELDRKEDALGAWKAALLHQPDNVNWLTSGALRASALGRHEEAREFIAKALAVEPQNEKLWRRAGWCRVDEGDWRGALEQFAHAKTLADEPGNNLLCGLAVALWHTGDRRAALETYAQLIKAEPETATAGFAESLKWTPVATKAVEIVRAETIKRHPELAPAAKEP